MNPQPHRESFEARANPHAGIEDGLPVSHLGLILEIEQQLGALHMALLKRDLEGLDQATRQLEHCHARLQQVARNAGPAKQTSWPHPGTDSPVIAEPLCEAQRRVLHLGRVQLALLARAQRSLTALCNLLAGSQATYGAPAANQTPKLICGTSFGEYRCQA